VDFLTSKIDVKITARDSLVGGNLCLKYRPDVLYDRKSHALVVEVDEDQHRHYDRGCEQTRMHNIVLSLGYPVIFLRYNPDALARDHGKRADREAALVERVRHWLVAECPADPLTVEYLFYDPVAADEPHIHEPYAASPSAAVAAASAASRI
jgi:hypothetical protein